LDAKDTVKTLDNLFKATRLIRIPR